MYVVQFGEDVRGKELAKLPADIPSLEKGEWKYSDELNGWVGYHLDKKTNEELYWKRVLE